MLNFFKMNLTETGHKKQIEFLNEWPFEHLEKMTL